MGTALVLASAKALGFTEQRFAGPEASLNYAVGPANGPPLLLLHGLSRDWHSFSGLLPELSRNFHVYALDLRGHGGSSRVTGAYRIINFAGDISAFIQSQSSDRVTIFGHSLGGMVGLVVTANLGERVKALVVGDAMINPADFRGTLYDALFTQLHAKLVLGIPQAQLARAIGKISIPVPGLDEPVRIEELPGNTPDVLAEWARSAARTDPEALCMTIDGSAFNGWQPRELLPRISCPTLLLQGNPELDGLLSDDDVKLATRLLPNAHHVQFPLLGHALFMQQPKPVLDEISKFLATIAD